MKLLDICSLIFALQLESPSVGTFPDSTFLLFKSNSMRIKVWIRVLMIRFYRNMETVEDLHSICSFVPFKKNQSFIQLNQSLISLIDRTDDQRCRVFTSIISTGTEVWVEFVSEGAASKGVDQSCSTYIIKGDQTLLIIHKHPHLLRTRMKTEGDWRGSTSTVLISISQHYSPETILRSQCDFSLPVDRLCGHS